MAFTCRSLVKIIFFIFLSTFAVSNVKKSQKSKGKEGTVVYQRLGATHKRWLTPKNWLTPKHWGNDLPERYDYYTVQARICTWVCRGMCMIEHQECLKPLSHHFILIEKGVKTPKQMVLTSKQLAKYLFAGQNS